MAKGILLGHFFMRQGTKCGELCHNAVTSLVKYSLGVHKLSAFGRFLVFFCDNTCSSISEVTWKRCICSSFDFQCVSTKDLLHKHNLNDTDSISRATFLEICPALVEQINGGFCVHRHNCSEKPYYLSIVVDRKMGEPCTINHLFLWNS